MDVDEEVKVVSHEEVKVYFLDKKSKRVELSINPKEAVLGLKTRIADHLKVGLSEIKIYINGLPFDDTTSLLGITNLEGALVLVKKEHKEEQTDEKEVDPGQDPILQAADMRNLLYLNKAEEPTEELLSLIKEHHMKHMYQSAWQQCDWKVDDD